MIHNGTLYLMKNVEDMVVFLGLYVLKGDDSEMFSSSLNAQVEKPQLKTIVFFKYKQLNIFIYFILDNTKLLRVRL